MSFLLLLLVSTDATGGAVQAVSASETPEQPSHSLTLRVGSRTRQGGSLFKPGKEVFSPGGTVRYDWTRREDGSLHVADTWEGLYDVVTHTSAYEIKRFMRVKTTRSAVVDAHGRLLSLDGRCRVVHGGRQHDYWTMQYDPSSRRLHVGYRKPTTSDDFLSSRYWKTKTIAVPAGAVPGPLFDLRMFTQPPQGKSKVAVIGDCHLSPYITPTKHTWTSTTHKDRDKTNPGGRMVTWTPSFGTILRTTPTDRIPTFYFSSVGRFIKMNVGMDEQIRR